MPRPVALPLPTKALRIARSVEALGRVVRWTLRALILAVAAVVVVSAAVPVLVGLLR